jgi:D-alanyl-D-alanine carboxypeptidase/D-alanyl-D-alanine-endopeptidase (penicillin-binding protein 4)
MSVMVPAHARPYWKQQIDRITAGKSIGVSVRDSGTWLYRHNDRVKRAPASNEKLLMTMALFNKLAPDSTIETTVWASSQPLAGIITGDIWLSGRGDPSITASTAYARYFPFRATTLGVLARTIAQTTTRIEGRVIGNTGYFEHDWFAPGWSSYFPAEEVAMPTSLTYNGNQRHGHHIRNPEWRAAKALTRKLESFGVEVTRRPRADAMPDDLTQLAVTESVPLSEMTEYMNRVSSNFFAEVFGKRLGVEAFGAPGTIAKGATAIENFARRRGVALIAYDSSGLSYSNRVAPAGIVKLLGTVEATEPYYEVLRRGLPTGGQGTLEDRLHGVKLRAKTGSLDGVSALSGWIYLQRTKSWAEFSILSSGMSYYPAKNVEDRIVTIIERYGR